MKHQQQEFNRETTTAMTDANQEYSLGGFGARLKAARETMNLSQKEAATRLHLSPNILQILESENFQKAPPATFIRGYLRSYARLLNFNEDDITAALTQSGLEAHTRTPVVPILHGESMQMTDQYVQWISTTVIVGLFIFVGAWWGFHSSNKNTSIHAAAQQAIAPQPTQAIQPAQTQTVQAQPLQPQQPVQTQPAPTTTVTQNTVTPAEPAPVAATPPPPTVTTVNPPETTPVQATAPPTIVAQPTTPPPVTSPSTVANSNPPAPPAAVVETAPVTASGLLPTIPGTAITPVPPNSTMASDTPKKRNRHRKQDSNVSGFAMALPEPGL